MLTLLHGDNIGSSRNALVSLKASFRGKEVRDLDGKSLDETSLTQAIESGSLFGNDWAVIIENLFGKITKQPKKIESLAKVLTRSAAATHIILWENRELPASVIKSLGKDAKVQVFSYPKLLFQFLDGLRPNDSRRQVEIYQSLIQTEAPELVFSMIVRRVRQLIIVKDKLKPDGMQSWQVSRLTNQAKLFTMDELLSMHKALFRMDSTIKTGASPFSLSELITQFIIDL